jgi:phenylpyruvate tautomerase PptA (4-oxalocrotonate tautomerase family)
VPSKDASLEPEFPVEFIVEGTPVSFQAALPAARNQWKSRVKAASAVVLDEGHWAVGDRVAVTLFYFPSEPMEGDIDNIVKPILDAMSKHIYLDDNQVDRVVVQRFEPGNVFAFSSPSETLADALTAPKPVLYVKVSDDPFEDLK